MARVGNNSSLEKLGEARSLQKDHGPESLVAQAREADLGLLASKTVITQNYVVLNHKVYGNSPQQQP